ncbi:hypothetical protein AB6A40_002485 [Gnathostoma spinigerum]|uniref:Uncharacterized protein n=1 Tax=Gnathostoma spinigerum TaxID=75299 RepID=A0ABD6EEF6_9BILA
MTATMNPSQRCSPSVSICHTIPPHMRTTALQEPYPESVKMIQKIQRRPVLPPMIEDEEANDEQATSSEENINETSRRGDRSPYAVTAEERCRTTSPVRHPHSPPWLIPAYWRSNSLVLPSDRSFHSRVIPRKRSLPLFVGRTSNESVLEMPLNDIIGANLPPIPERRVLRRYSDVSSSSVGDTAILEEEEEES